MSLTDPTSKMSKSHKSERSRILITDTPDEIRAKISSALTDSHAGISYDMATRPGISNLLDILSIFDAQQRTPAELANAYSQTHPREFKGMVADSVTQGLHGIRSRFLESVAPSFLRLTLAGGRSRRTRSSCGFSPARHPSVTYRG